MPDHPEPPPADPQRGQVLDAVRRAARNPGPSVRGAGTHDPVGQGDAASTPEPTDQPSPHHPPTDLPASHDSVARQVPADADLVALFAERAAAVGANVVVVAADDVASTLADKLGDCPRERTLIDDNVLQEFPALAEILPPPQRDDNRDHDNDDSNNADDNDDDDNAIFTADVGVTVADWAVAETGTIVVVNADTRSRFTSLAPPHHIALLDAKRIVPDLIDLFNVLGRNALPSCVNLITGPSKTGDIEGVLVTGVHGPGRVDVIVVESE